MEIQDLINKNKDNRERINTPNITDEPVRKADWNEDKQETIIQWNQ